MNYPPWDVPLLGGGMLIGVVAILHVFVAHFAVGGGLFLVWTERRARRTGDDELMAFCRTHSTFFVLVVLVLGAVSGAGIWWTIGLVHPPATSTLLHVFVWVWAIEWVFFFVEIAAAFVYYYGWDRLDPRTHVTVGWIYFGTAWMSLVLINGILSFMLTPGGWVENGSLVSAWFNPTMLPSLLIRTAVCVAIAGLYALLVAQNLSEEEGRAPITRYAAGWVLAGTAVIPFGGVWYIAEIPELARHISMGGAPAVTIFAGLTILLSGLVVAATFFGPWRRPGRTGVVLVALIAFLGLSVTGVTEWVREAVRKPWIIYDHMYSNAIREGEVERIDEVGILPTARWTSLDRVEPGRELEAGREIFRVECRTCHTIDGFHGIRPMVRGWREEFIEFQLRHLDELEGFMPPFAGTEAERRALAAWLAALGSSEPFRDVVEPDRDEEGP